jgi:SAM-dependent methyltransferase
MNELEPGTHYSFFDHSPFVVSYLQTVAELQGADVSVVEGDIRQLKRPAHPLAVLRTKNAVAYVPDFENKLEEMADWVAPGGRLVLQNDPVDGQRELIIEKHGPLALRLLREGWDLSIEFESQRGAEHSLDTLIFTRPKGAAPTRTAAEAKAAWQRYVAAARKAAQAGMLRFFFR